MLNKLKDVVITLLAQYPWPHHALSRGVHALTRIKLRPIKAWLIRRAIKSFKIDMSIAQHSNIERYESFNHFFTRGLKPEARPIVQGEHELASPVDGLVSQLGKITQGKIFQAKNHNFDVTTLLGGSGQRAAPFINGYFNNIYLSPRDYHRIHMPCTGTLKEMVHVPGRLFSVSPRTTRVVPGLCARNERVIALFDTEYGPMAMVLVGAIFVGSIDTVWSGNVTPRPGNLVQRWDYTLSHKDNPPLTLQRGAEMGRFNMGSTVILLFGDQAVSWDAAIQPESFVQMGQLLGIAHSKKTFS
ncbi:MAG: phosphatidylserine decarboxylase [Gammaproteobacteria bacterium]|nr:phosphatidylserine decarboxylase [Gammaproteobacteria bacterium]